MAGATQHASGQGFKQQQQSGTIPQAGEVDLKGFSPPWGFRPDDALAMSALDMNNEEKKRKFEDAVNGAGGTAPALTRTELHAMLDTLPKEQMVELLIDAGFEHMKILDRINELASRDPVHRKLFVRGLAWETTTETLREAFSQYGEIEEGAVIIDKATGKSRGFGFITYKQTDAAHRALREPSKRIDGRITICNLAAQGHINHATLTDVALRKVYVGSLAYETTTESLLSYFSQFGEIEEGSVAYDKNTNKSRGFAFVTFKSVEGALRATIESTKYIDGRQVMVKIASEAQKEKISNSGPSLSPAFLQPSYGTGYNMPGVHHSLAGSGLGSFRSQLPPSSLGLNTNPLPASLSSRGEFSDLNSLAGSQSFFGGFNSLSFGQRDSALGPRGGLHDYPNGANGASLYFH